MAKLSFGYFALFFAAKVSIFYPHILIFLDIFLKFSLQAFVKPDISTGKA